MLVFTAVAYLFGLSIIILACLVFSLVAAISATARANRTRVAGYCALAIAGTACVVTARVLDTSGGAINGPAVWGSVIGSILWITGAVGVIVEGSRARRSSAHRAAANRASVPQGYTVDGRPIFPVVGYTSDGVVITADQAVGPFPGHSGTNSMAIAALIGGLVMAPVGIVCGHIALAQISATRQGGRGLAIAGLVLGYSWIALVMAVGVGLMAAYQI